MATDVKTSTHYLADEIGELGALLDRLVGIRDYVANIETENAMLRDEVGRLNKEREDEGSVPAFEVAAKAIRDGLGRGGEDWHQFVPAAFAALLHAPAESDAPQFAQAEAPRRCNSAWSEG